MMNTKMLGTLSQMAADLERMYGAENQLLTTPDGNKINCFFLPATHQYFKRFGHHIYAPCTMIVCNPNLGFAEGQIYNSEWPNFYLDYGINVVLWNYRGYGQSTGFPSPGRNRRDVELVFSFARNKTNEVVHG